MAEFDTTVMNAVREGLDLTLRQTSVLLLCRDGATDQDRTVAGLAAELRISKPAVTRALDRLEMFRLGARRRLEDRRVVAFDLTRQGDALRTRLLGGMAPEAQRGVGRLEPVRPVPRTRRKTA